MRPLGLTLSQNRDQVTGEILLDPFRGPVTGTIDGNGRFSGSANSSTVFDGIPFTINVPTLNLNSEAGRLTGDFVASMTAAGVPGNGYLELDLHTVTRGSSGLRSTSTSGPSWRSRLGALKRP